MSRSSLPLFLAALAFAPVAFAASDDAAKVKGFAPVSVSAANYRNTPREQLVQAVEFQQAAVNPEAPNLKPLTKPQYFVFLPGEIFESDLKYDQVTALLTAALAKKGYVNAADPQGIIREPEKVTLMLRVNYGTLPWRLPTVRSRDITWYDGMIARPRGAMGLHNLGAERTWDQRAGGNDDSLDALAKNDANPNGGGFSSGSSRSNAGGGGSNQGAAVNSGDGTTSIPGLAEYGSTRDFHIIVVDAFDYQELKSKGKSAVRLWTTFVSAPKQGKQKFSEIAETLAKNAIPYFGETSKGLQVYSDVRAEVKIGELIEVKDEPEKK